MKPPRLLLLTSAISNHNCPVLLVRRIHGRKALVLFSSFPAPLLPFLSLTFSIFVSFSVASSIFFILAPLIASLLPVSSERRSIAVTAVGAKLPQFCTFYTAREKKRIIFGGNATILSAVVMWDQLVSTAAARYTCPSCVLRSSLWINDPVSFVTLFSSKFILSFDSEDNTFVFLIWDLSSFIYIAAILTPLTKSMLRISFTSYSYFIYIDESDN